MALQLFNPDNTTGEPRKGLGQFWSNTKAQREVWAQPVENRWLQLAPFFKNDEDSDTALKSWLAQRWDGVNQFCPPRPIDEDERALGLACGIRGIPERVRHLMAALTSPHGTVARDPLVEGATRAIHKEMQDPPAFARASARLADNWAAVSATNQLGEFEQNLASLIYFIHLLLIRTPQYFATGRIDSITRTPRMYALAAVLGSPLVAFKERNFLAARGNFSWTTLSTFCHWFERDARPLLPPRLQELEQFMWHKIRGFIWNQYREQSVDAHTFVFNDLVRDVVSRANMCMRQLSYEKSISPLLAVLPMRGRISSATNDRAVSHETVESESQLVEIPPGLTGSSSQGADEAASSSVVTTSKDMLKSRETLPQVSSIEAEKLKWRQQLFREYGGAPKPIPITSIGRKRANSVDATSSRPGDSKRHRGLDAPGLARTGVSVTTKLELPAFPAQGSDRKDVIVINDEDDDDDDDDDEGAAWFDYVGPKKASAAKNDGTGPETKAGSQPKDDASKARASKRVSEKKAQRDAKEKEKEKDGHDAVAGAKTGRGKQRKSARKPKAKADKSKKNDPEPESESELEKKSYNSKADDRESEDEDDEVPWHGPVNLEPFDGGFGLADEEPMDEVAELLHSRLFPSAGWCTDEFWKRRTRGHEFNFFADTDEPASAVSFGFDTIRDLEQLEVLVAREWCADDDPDFIMELEYDTHESFSTELEIALCDPKTSGKVIVARGPVTCKPMSYEAALRQFTGDAPMECQIPGIMYADNRSELSTKDMLFTLDPKQFLQCTQSRAKSGVNWLSGATEEDSEWVKVVRSYTVDMRTEWERTSASVADSMHAFPGRQLNFVIAATAGAYSGIHVDASGFGTIVEEVWGDKIWWILIPNRQAHPEIFKDPLQDPRKIPFKYWKIHSIRLRAGDMIAMPPGTVHCIWSAETCLTRGGHFLSGQTLTETLAVNMLIKHVEHPPTNASHNSVLQMVVARRVLLIIQVWESELEAYCRRRDRVKWARNTDDLPSLPGEVASATQTAGRACDWFALSFLLRNIAPTMFDNQSEKLLYAYHNVQSVHLKAALFVEFWTKRTRSTNFAASVEEAAKRFLEHVHAKNSQVQPLPSFWQPEVGNAYPPSLPDYPPTEVRLDV